MRSKSIPEYSFCSALKHRKDLKKCGRPLTLFALQLFFDIEDITSIAIDDIVDGPDDGGLDVIHIDKEQKFVVIAQEYEATSTRKTVASAKKVRGLSNSLSLLLKVPIKDVPERLRSSAEELRGALSNGEIERVYIWYVHNLSGSENVKAELRTVEQTAQALLKECHIKEINSLEVCAEIIEERYKSISTPILINDKFKIKIPGGMPISADNWKAYVTSVPAQWLHEQFKKYETKLFSANVRDYLGIVKRSDKNINKSIQETAQNDPNHFWVFNNGITALVHDFKINKYNDILSFNGFSILNGAQTTGAIGNLQKIPHKSVMVQLRFVKCSDKQTVVNIKKYNNSQNKIEASDFRSKDSIQVRLLKEFKNTDIQYLPRRGGIEDAIRRKSNALPSVLTGQVISAFHGSPDIAYHQKTKIWEDDALYIRYFNEQLSANHIIFAYSLFEAIRSRKLLLNKKNKKKELKKLEEDQLSFFQTRGSIFLLTAAIANCLETFLDTSIPNRFRLEFSKRLSFKEAEEKWKPLVETACSFVSHLKEGFSEGAVHEKQALIAIKKFSELITATKVANKNIYSAFSQRVKQR